MRGCRTVVGAVVGAMIAGAAVAAEPPPPIERRVGPLTLGMPIEAVKQAIPGASWRETQASPSGKVTAIETYAPWPEVGARARIFVRNDRRGQELIVGIDLIAPPAANQSPAQACLEAIKPLADEQAAGVGGLQAPPPSTVRTPSYTSWQMQRIEGAIIPVPITMGGGTRTVGERIEISPQASALLDARGRGGGAMPLARWGRRGPDSFSLFATSAVDEAGGFLAQFDGSFDARGGPSCMVQIALRQDLPLGPRKTYPLTRERVVQAPTIAVRRLAAGIAGTEAVGASADLTCLVQPATGQVMNCGLDPEAPRLTAPVFEALSLIASRTVLSMAGLDVDEPQPYAVTLPVTLTAADVAPIDFLETPRTPRVALSLSRMPNAPWPSAESRGLGGIVDGSVTLACQVQADLSVFCTGAKGSTPALVERERMFDRLMGASLIAAPTLVDGRSAIGAVFDQIIEFRAAE